MNKILQFVEHKKNLDAANWQALYQLSAAIAAAIGFDVIPDEFRYELPSFTIISASKRFDGAWQQVLLVKPTIQPPTGAEMLECGCGGTTGAYMPNEVYLELFWRELNAEIAETENA